MRTICTQEQLLNYPAKLPLNKLKLTLVTQGNAKQEAVLVPKLSITEFFTLGKRNPSTLRDAAQGPNNHSFILQCHQEENNKIKRSQQHLKRFLQNQIGVTTPRTTGSAVAG